MFSKPEIRMRCSKCKFVWIAKEQFPTNLEKLYMKNRYCISCKKEDVVVDFEKIDRWEKDWKQE